ncbi:MAG: hypothetical protein AB1540_16675 [Bdellovibrionota bacterium]
MKVLTNFRHFSRLFHKKVIAGVVFLTSLLFLVSMSGCDEICFEDFGGGVRCPGTSEIVLDALGFNPAFRPDKQPVAVPPGTELDASWPPSHTGLVVPFYSDGAATGLEIATPIRPVLSGQHKDKLYQLRRSKCYYAPRSEQLNVAYELVLKLEGDEIFPSPFTAGACSITEGFIDEHGYLNARLAHYLSRRDVQNADGETILLRGFSLAGEVATDLKTCVAHQMNSFDECEQINLSNCSWDSIENICPKTNQYPFACVSDCAFSMAPRGTEFQYGLNTSLVFLDPKLPQNQQRTLATGILYEPIVKPVDTSRVLARPLRLVAMGSPGRPPFAYEWRVEENADGTWKENFSPQLSLSSVRVFIKSGNVETGGKIYLEPSQLLIDGIGCRVNRSSQPGVYLEGCTSLAFSNPAYAVGDPSIALNWRVVFNSSPSYTQNGIVRYVRADEPLYIEFTVVDASRPALLVINNELIDFGTLYPTASNIPYGFPIEVSNSSGVRAEILRVFFTGANANAFSITPIQTPPSPNILNGGIKQQYNLVYRGPSPQGTRLQANLVVEYREILPNGTASSLIRSTSKRVTAVVESGGVVTLFHPVPQTAPYRSGELSFRRGRFDGGTLVPEREYIKPVSIQNIGYGAAQVLGYQVSGPNAASFRIFNGGSRMTTTVPSNLVSGGFSDFWIEFMPYVNNTPADQSATLSIQTTAGDVSVQLNGVRGL